MREGRWIVGFLLLAGLLLWQVSPVLLPFVAGAAIAYFLDPIVGMLERRSVPRALGSLLTMVAFFLLACLVLLLFFPILQVQAVELAQRFPGILQTLQARANDFLREAQQSLGIEGVNTLDLRAAAGMEAGKFLTYATQVFGNFLARGLAIINIISLIFVTPVVAFYLLRDWNKLLTRIDSWLPQRAAKTIREQAREIDLILAGFARGQLLLCLGLGVFYAVGLRLAGLDFGLILGFLTGLLSFIPFVGVFIGGLTSLGLALLQFDQWEPRLIVVGVFVAGQILEAYGLQPWLVGDRVRLHPVWIVFALLAGGSLFGFLGVLLAVPGMAALGVLARFGLGRYLISDFYASTPHPPNPPDPK